MKKIDEKSLEKLGVPQLFYPLGGNFYRGEDNRIYTLLGEKMHLMGVKKRKFTDDNLEGKTSEHYLLDDDSLVELGIPQEFMILFGPYREADVARKNRIFKTDGKEYHLLEKGSDEYIIYQNKLKIYKGIKALKLEIDSYETKLRRCEHEVQLARMDTDGARIRRNALEYKQNVTSRDYQNVQEEIRWANEHEGSCYQRLRECQATLALLKENLKKLEAELEA